MRRLRELVIDAKHNADGVAPALVKQMLNKNVFLFGFVDISGDSSNRGCEEIIKLNENCVQNSIEKYVGIYILYIHIVSNLQYYFMVFNLIMINIADYLRIQSSIVMSTWIL